MKLQTNLYQNGAWEKELDSSLDSVNTLITLFGTRDFDLISAGVEEVFKKFPKAVISGCSTAGEIYEDELHDGSLVVSITQFEKTELQLEYVSVDSIEESLSAGSKLAQKFNQKQPKMLLVVADPIGINGSDLVRGLNGVLDHETKIVGGMAGDADRFEKAWVLVDKKPVVNCAIAVGFYGEHFQMDYSAEGGWNKFGLERVVTSCDPLVNTIFTLDHKPALELYKYYMGEHAKALPASALKFPFLVIDNEGDVKIRAIFKADEENQAVTLLDDVVEGDKVVFLKGSSSYIIAGARKAAKSLVYSDDRPVLSIAISCMGRRAVLCDRTEDEIDVVKEALGDNVTQVGFYSYGELSPRESGKCGMLNQTMALTLIWEN